MAVADAEVLPESADQPPVGGVDQPAEPYPGDPAQPPAEAASPAEHREYQWDGGQEADDLATAGLDDIADCTLKPGDRVNALRPDGMLIGWVVLAEPYIHADGMPVVDIADHTDYLAAQKQAISPSTTWPNHSAT